jgi:acetate kinase
MEELNAVAKLAPLHDPVNIEGIKAAQELFPKQTKQVTFLSKV